jgi:hypothetical protein
LISTGEDFRLTEDMLDYREASPSLRDPCKTQKLSTSFFLIKKVFVLQYIQVRERQHFEIRSSTEATLAFKAST